MWICDIWTKACIHKTKFPSFWIIMDSGNSPIVFTFSSYLIRRESRLLMRMNGSVQLRSTKKGQFKGSSNSMKDTEITRTDSKEAKNILIKYDPMPCAGSAANIFATNKIHAVESKGGIRTWCSLGEILFLNWDNHHSSFTFWLTIKNDYWRKMVNKMISFLQLLFSDIVRWKSSRKKNPISNKDSVTYWGYTGSLKTFLSRLDTVVMITFCSRRRNLPCW